MCACVRPCVRAFFCSLVGFFVVQDAAIQSLEASEGDARKTMTLTSLDGLVEVLMQQARQFSDTVQSQLASVVRACVRACPFTNQANVCARGLALTNAHTH